MNRRTLLRLGGLTALGVPVVAGTSVAETGSSVHVEFDVTGKERDSDDKYDWNDDDAVIDKKGDYTRTVKLEFVAGEPDVDAGFTEDEDTREFMWQLHLDVEDKNFVVEDYHPTHMDAEKDTEPPVGDVRVWGELIMQKSP